ncbi:hypothetical protein SKAU_G00029380 [Synaphobranchus kaupii]|uniref:Uncharacterized protein n=1 Tax=Synaphobranchus kaupii TaxID=118154 RepID=A0A9Q1GDG8_SYNKA|nr:hypothetical protein SKAU_G00029380 [Synaphobranchus kaupii]
MAFPRDANLRNRIRSFTSEGSVPDRNSADRIRKCRPAHDSRERSPGRDRSTRLQHRKLSGSRRGLPASPSAPLSVTVRSSPFDSVGYGMQRHVLLDAKHQ